MLLSSLTLAFAALAAQQTAAWKTEQVTLAATPAPLAGTLTVPNGAGPVPLAIIIAGSGPTDRDGNSVGTAVHPASYRLLAEGLAAKGIATLRYDKRGIGESRAAMLAEADLRFDMLADDAVAWGKKYRGDPRFSFIVIVGHSEGSLLGMLASQRLPADAYVSIAGPARRADKVLHEQLARQLPAPLLAQADSVLASMVAGHTADNPPPALAALFRPSVQPYFISWLKYAGGVEIAKLRMPVLIVQGSTDAQVAPFEADSLALALPAAKVLRIDGMNHVFKHAAGDMQAQMPAYTDPTMPVVPQLISGIASFIIEAAAKKPRS